MRILVVEDNEDLANSIKRGLEKEGYSVQLAFDGDT
ncbi:MAG: response regulator transcription factor, partial [Pseudothermotoga sp.]|nr:response regulator transcription factor [Pseudothermotoga sp.]